MDKLARKIGSLKARQHQKIKDLARGTRDRNVRIKLELFCLAIRLGSVSEACERRGFSRRFYYRWWKRFHRSGFQLRSLQECSRRPKRSPKQISPRLEGRILWFSRRQYGARMIEAYLKREGSPVSRSTICHVLRRRRRKKLKRRERLKTHQKRYELLIPGQRLQMDVKYVPERVAGERAYCYVAIDECTRWRLARIYPSLNPSTTVEFLEELKRAMPFPIACIQTDNGPEFTYSLQSCQNLEHPMDTWCREQKIRHRRIPPGVKELNGKVERSHRIDEQYFYWRASTESLDEINRQLDRWMKHYNQKRLHGGLNYLTPEEKLKERRQSLMKAPVPALSEDLERLRLRFIRPRPIRVVHEDAELFRLEQELKRLLKQAA